MTRSSFVVRTLGLGIFLLGSIACGDKPPPKPPESTPSSDDGGSSEAASGGDSDGGTATASSDPGSSTPPAAPAGLALPAASAKLKFKHNKKDVDVELKSDGSVTTGGKATAKISGMEFQSADGKATLKVDGDGNITVGEGGAYAKFDGDDLTTQANTKVSIGEDGAINSTNDKGVKSAMGKSEGVGAAKRAALLAVAYTLWGTKAPAPPAAKAKPGGKKPAGKK